MAIKPLPPKLAKQARANSVKQLCDLYNIVIGVALSIAIYGIIDTTKTPIPFKTNNSFSFLVFIIIIIPFYHGAVRHLYITYVEEGSSARIKSYALFLDYIILFFEGGLFVALALVLNSLQSFLVVLIGLLILDCVWGFLAHFGFTGSYSQNAEKIWATINAIFFPLLIVVYLYAPDIIGWGLMMQATIFVLMLIRTGVDYYYSWRFYFPALGSADN